MKPNHNLPEEVCLQDASWSWLRTFIEKEHLPSSFIDVIQSTYFPLATRIAGWKNQHTDGPLMINICGAQGTGKTTLTHLLMELLQRNYGLQTVNPSIDDLYHTRATRLQLAQHIHPLLATRGVPGTHDLPLAFATLDALLAGKACTLPRFDKARDDRSPEEEWTPVDTPIDIILFEGWCVGAIPQEASQLGPAINALEQSEDPNGSWRNFVNTQLAEEYAPLFAKATYLIMLKAPDFECIHRWRGEQEAKLADRRGSDSPGVMNKAQLARFIMHYERLTRWILDEMPQRADVLLSLQEDHRYDEVRGL